MIQRAAELIQAEMLKRGQHIDINEALALARSLHQIWSARVVSFPTSPGDIARYMRRRYEGDPPVD